MQSGVPSLPVVCSDKHSHSCSSSKYSDSISGTPRKNGTPHLLKRRSFGEMYANCSYRNSARFHSFTQPNKSRNQVCQRVLSAKMLRVKQLQNQLTDAHYHLNELSNENKLLKAIQKKQESALKRYEGTNAELPRIINSHHEELRILRLKYKKLKDQHKNTCDILKKKEKDLQSLMVCNKRLHELSQDRNLMERDKLQSLVSDLNHQIQQQQDTIQMLNKKLTLETKSLKQQNHAEMVKHKETQKTLQETLEKLKSLEDLLDNREKRLYYNNQLPSFAKNRNAGNSYSSLEDSGVSLNYSKSSLRKMESDMNEKILPTLSDQDINFDKKMNGKVLQDCHLSFTSLEKKLRPSKFGNRSISAKSLDYLDKSPNVSVMKTQVDEKLLSINAQELDAMNLHPDHHNEEEEEKLLKKNPMDERDHLHIPDLSEEIHKIDDEINLEHENLCRKSREVCARLTSDLSPRESLKPWEYHRTNCEEIEQMVKSEFKLGQDSAASMLKDDFYKNYKLQTDTEKSDDSENDARDPSLLPTLKFEDLQSSEINLSNDELQDEHQKIESNNSPTESGSKTFRQLINSEEIDDVLSDKMNSLMKDEIVEDSQLESAKNLKSVDSKEKLDVYLDGVSKSKMGNNKSEKVDKSRRNSSEQNEKTEVTKKSFNKDELLAAMKAIDDNDNIEFYEQKDRRNGATNSRSQITENLYRGLPTKKRGDTIISTLTNSKSDAKTRGNGFTKFH